MFLRYPLPMQTKWFFILAVAALLPLQTFSQEQPVQDPDYLNLAKAEEKLKIIGDSIVLGTTEKVRVQAVMDFIPQFVKVLRMPGSFEYPFDSLLFMKKLKPKDEKFRLYNWTLEFKDGSYRFYGALQMNLKDTFLIYPLFDRSSDMAGNLEDTTVTNENWIGAQYYQVIDNQRKKKKNKFYTLIGYDGNNSMSNKKLVETLYFEDDKPYFGHAAIEVNDTLYKRWYFEFRDDAIMHLNYVPGHNMITADNLVPPKPENKGKKFTYLPSGAYDYFLFKRGKWIFHEDLFGTYKKKINPSDLIEK